MTWGSATIRLVPAFLRAVPPDHLARGGARKRESRERRTRDLPGISDLPGARSMGFGFGVDRSCISPIKHRKNCECCPGHYLSTSVY